MEDLRRINSRMPSCAHGDGRVIIAMLQHLRVTRRRAPTKKLVLVNILSDMDATPTLPEVQCHSMTDHNSNNRNNRFLPKHLHKAFLGHRLMLVWGLIFLLVKTTEAAHRCGVRVDLLCLH